MSSSASSFATPNCKTLTSIDPKKIDLVEGRLCGFLDDLLAHKQLIHPLKNKAHHICRCRGKIAHHVCEVCPDKPSLCVKCTGDKTNSCFLNCHNVASFGLWRDDCVTIGSKRRTDWQCPNTEEFKSSQKEMKRLNLSLFESTDASGSGSPADASSTTDNLHTAVTSDLK